MVCITGLKDYGTVDANVMKKFSYPHLYGYTSVRIGEAAVLTLGL
ncbi:MAG: hypothetical protein QW364_03500 [Thermoplasmatales archaeon]